MICIPVQSSQFQLNELKKKFNYISINLNKWKLSIVYQYYHIKLCLSIDIIKFYGKTFTHFNSSLDNRPKHLLAYKFIGHFTFVNKKSKCNC